MALLQYRAPVNYEAQIEAFRDFLETFKASASASEESATNAIDGLQIDEDDGSEDYDFMDDVAGQGHNGTRGRQSHRDKRKYIALLHEIADRVKSHIVIELDDLDLVGCCRGIARHSLT